MFAQGGHSPKMACGTRIVIDGAIFPVLVFFSGCEKANYSCVKCKVITEVARQRRG